MSFKPGINVTRRTAVALALAAVGAACAAPPPPETNVALTLTGGADMNGARPAKVKVYYLLAAATFGSADFFEVFEQPEVALGADLLGVEEFTIAPGRILTASKQFDVPLAAIGVVAAFQNIDGPGWRAIAPVVRHAANTITVSLAGDTVSAAGQVATVRDSPLPSPEPSNLRDQPVSLPPTAGAPLSGLGNVLAN